MKRRGARAVRWPKHRPETEIGHSSELFGTQNFARLVREKNSLPIAPSPGKIDIDFRLCRAVLLTGQNRKKMKEKETKKTEACKNDTAEQKRAADA